MAEENKYALKPNKFRVTQWKNPGNKYPTLNFEIDVDGEQKKLAVWINENDRTITYSGHSTELITFFKALFGVVRPKEKQEEQPQNTKAQSFVAPAKDEDRKSLLR